MTECICCFNKIENDDSAPCSLSIICSNGHSTCKPCISTIVRSCISTQKEIQCYETTYHCCGTFNTAKLEETIDDPDITKKYFNTISKINIQKAGVAGFVNCFNCDNGGIVKSNKTKMYICDGCGKETCVNCGNAGHRGRNCGEQDLEYRELKQIGKTSIVCKCRHKFSKLDDGTCNKLTCPNCRQAYCYICGQKILCIGYKHFDTSGCTQVNAGTGTCPLYGGTPLVYNFFYVKFKNNNYLHKLQRFFSKKVTY